MKDLKLGDKVTVCFDATIEMIAIEGRRKVFSIKNSAISGAFCWVAQEDIQNKIVKEEEK